MSEGRDAQFIDWNAETTPFTAPSPETLGWVERQVGRRIVEIAPLAGGMSSAVHRLTLEGSAERVVLRRYTQADWLQREPHIPHDEARNLELLGRLDPGVATPHLVAADPDGDHGDVPAIVMTEVSGRPDIDPATPGSWADRLAACLAGIHAVPIPRGLPAYRRWDQPTSPLPRWATKPELWHRAKATVAGDLPAQPSVFLHRDFHPNNVHWHRGEICGVVDWLGACVGPAAADVSHCRWNLAVLVNPETAERFTTRYRSMTGFDEDLTPYDLATILSGPVGHFPTDAWNSLGRRDLTSSVAEPRIEAWLDHVLSATGSR